MTELHSFNLKTILSQNNLSFYNQVKFVNFMRRQVIKYFIKVKFSNRFIDYFDLFNIDVYQ